MKTTELRQIAAQCGRVVVFASLIGASSLLRAEPLGTAFTSQAKLVDGGQPASGIFDLQFMIYDATGGGTPFAGPLTNAVTGAANGLFTVTLDFGGGVFTGEARWLEIGVRTNGSASNFTTLPPRQALTPAPYTPYALHSPDAVLQIWSSPSLSRWSSAVFLTDSTGITNLTDSAIATERKYYRVQEQ